MSYVKRAIDVTIILGTGQFGESGQNTLKLSGSRVTADIETSTGYAQGTLDARIYGLSLDKLNQLTQIGPTAATVARNSIIVEAGDVGTPLTKVFDGTIWPSFADFQGIPDSCLVVHSDSCALGALKPIDPNSWKGSTQVASIMAKLAQQMGFAFANNGVDAVLSNPYFGGSALAQVRSCARAANIWYATDLNTLTIWPKGAGRNGPVINLSQETGLIGYPVFNAQGIMVQHELIPDALCGISFNLKTTMPNSPADGVWNIASVKHHISAELPGGPWFTELQGFHLGA
jgi:hypothetical protein